jgi:hypothetical protein
MGEKRWVEKLQWQRPTARPGNKWKDDVEVVFQKMWCGNVSRIQIGTKKSNGRIL